jgi:hypothetical protein
MTFVALHTVPGEAFPRYPLKANYSLSLILGWLRSPHNPPDLFYIQGVP